MTDWELPACWERGADHPALPDYQEAPKESVPSEGGFGSCQQYFLKALEARLLYPSALSLSLISGSDVLLKVYINLNNFILVLY